MLHIIVAAAMIFASLPVRAQPTRPPTVAATRQRVKLSVERYYARARALWMQSERKRLANLSEARKSTLFGPYVHCHVREIEPRFVMPILAAYSPVSVSSAYALCPSWLLSDTPDSVLAAASNGLYLGRIQADSLRPAADSLNALLQFAVAATPGDAWLLGQLVRHRVIHRWFDEALRPLKECSVDRWFCEALGGYVEHERGNTSIAERRFGLALNAMPVDVRCALLDVGPILPSAIRDQYEALACEQRAELAERYFWLADPRWSEMGNARRTVHLARKVALILATANESDERFNWRYAQGGAAVAEVVLRYGWPSLNTWIGVQTDTSHSNYLVTRSTAPNAPYFTAEYHGTRVAFGAPSLLFVDESLAPDAAWRLVAPLGTFAEHRRNSDEVWWPFEHIPVSDYRVEEFADWQLATFRRERDNLLALAVVLDAKASVDSLYLLLGVRRDSSVVVATKAGANGASTHLSGRFGADRGVLSLEQISHNARTLTLGRLRLGYRAPVPLERLHPESLAVSDPVLFRSDAALPANVDDLLPIILPSVRVAASSVGVFWETYNVEPGEQVEPRRLSWRLG
ncbi:hypothetical protein [Gemmatimonas sp.]|uniref:hypothetical protein n=1 Tax=Gemmatimonas sp. TaxID=1962908 RepID=UPI00391956EC